MQVTSSTAAPGLTPTPDPTATQQASLDYSSFLRLLIAQMKNQDPTKPMDSAQYIGQLASFSSVEQAVKTNAKLDALMSAFALTQSESFIGRYVMSADGSVSGQVVSVRVISDGAVAQLDNGAELLLGPGITVA
jgi:flagellar basal-body rod modification protein FlgD